MISLLFLEEDLLPVTDAAHTQLWLSKINPAFSPNSQHFKRRFYKSWCPIPKIRWSSYLRSLEEEIDQSVCVCVCVVYCSFNL